MNQSSKGAAITRFPYWESRRAVRLGTSWISFSTDRKNRAWIVTR